jgi:hypothetical protein
MYRPACDEPSVPQPPAIEPLMARRGVGSASTLPQCAYQAATPMYGDHGMGVDRPSRTIAAFAPGC